MKHLSAALIPALLFPAIAQAQSVFDLDEIVFSAEFGATTLQETGTSISVVTGEELAASGETRVVDYIARLPGVDVRARGPMGSLTSITIRGAGQNYVRVLVDGIDVSDVSGTQHAFDFGSLTTADISRIELLRGGQSAVYGSEAIGGVINITTRRAEGDGVQQFATIEAGSYNSFRGSYGVAADIGALDYAFSLTRTQTDGFSAADENSGNSEADGFESNRLSFSVGHDLANGGRVGVNGFIEDARLEFDEFSISDGTPNEVSWNDSFGLRAYLKLPTGVVESTIDATYYEIERDVEQEEGFGLTRNLYAGQRSSFGYLGSIDLSAASSLRFGLDTTREKFSLTGTWGPDSGENDIFGIFSEISWSPSETLDLAATIRHDEHSRFGGLTSGRLASSWRPVEDWILRASAAQSFRAPSLYEMFYRFGGNPLLQPEESRSLDLGIERRIGGDAFLRATAFYNETDNVIDYVASNYTQVPGTVRRRGVELEFGTAITANWRVDGNYTVTTGENPTLTAGNAWNLEFPGNDLSVTLSGEITERLSTTLSMQSVRNRPTLADYTVANASFTYAISDAVDAYLRIENLQDTEYQLSRGYGTSDRAFYLGLRSRF